MLTTLSLGGFYFLSGKDAFFLLVILTSFGIYMTLPIFDAIVADISSKNDYSKSYGGMYGVGFFLGALIPLGLGLISDYIEPRAGFLLLSGLMLISFVATSRFK
jgi:MFS-type transporter involved in bile tolerance (Atg22 family)